MVGETGATIMEDNVALGVVVVSSVVDWLDAFVDEHAAMPIVKAAINPTVKQDPIKPICFLFITILLLLNTSIFQITLIAVANYFSLYNNAKDGLLKSMFQQTLNQVLRTVAIHK